jgi:hypothetical protein
MPVEGLCADTAEGRAGGLRSPSALSFRCMRKAWHQSAVTTNSGRSLENSFE